MRYNKQPVRLHNLRTNITTYHPTITDAAYVTDRTPSAIHKAIQNNSIIARTYTATYTTDDQPPTQPPTPKQTPPQPNQKTTDEEPYKALGITTADKIPPPSTDQNTQHKTPTNNTTQPTHKNTHTNTTTEEHTHTTHH